MYENVQVANATKHRMRSSSACNVFSKNVIHFTPCKYLVWPVVPILKNLPNKSKLESI